MAYWLFGVEFREGDTGGWQQVSWGIGGRGTEEATKHIN
jgi:hypothetical protein